MVVSFGTVLAAPLALVFNHLFATVRATQVHDLVIVENSAHKSANLKELCCSWRQILSFLEQLITKLHVVTVLQI